MLERIFSVGLDALAVVVPVSIAATNIVFFPLAALWLFGAKWTWPKWPPIWGWPEKLFLVYLGISLISSLAGLDIYHSLREIKNKDFYIFIAIVLVALVRERQKHERMMAIFMGAGLFTAVWGLIQYAIGVNIADKSDNFALYLPPLMKHWPHWVINLFALINGRVIGTRGHPLAYAECLLFNWAFAICFLLSSRGKEWIKWLVYLGFIGGGLLVSQSRGPWVAAAIILGLAVITSKSPRKWILIGTGAAFIVIFAVVPVLRVRAVSISDKSNNSNKERLHMWKAGWQLWTTHPLLGIGPGNVKQVSPAFQTPEEHVWGAWGHLHSLYVNGLTERGALGLLSFLLFMGAFVWEFTRALYQPSDDPWRSAVLQATLLGILGFMISGLTEAVYNTAVVIMTFYFVVGLGLALVRHEQ